MDGLCAASPRIGGEARLAQHPGGAKLVSKRGLNIKVALYVLIFFRFVCMNMVNGPSTG